MRLGRARLEVFVEYVGAAELDYSLIQLIRCALPVPGCGPPHMQFESMQRTSKQPRNDNVSQSMRSQVHVVLHNSAIKLAPMPSSLASPAGAAARYAGIWAVTS